MVINESDPHFKNEEEKPEFIETKGFKYQVFEDHIRFLFEDKELRVKIWSLEQILSNSLMYKNHGYHTGQCIDCHKFDALVNGYCGKCFEKNGMEYEEVAKKGG